MRRLLLALLVVPFALSGCKAVKNAPGTPLPIVPSSSSIAAKPENQLQQYTCAPQNIQYDYKTKILKCVKPSSSDIDIDCNGGTFTESGDSKSCIGSDNIKYTIKPIVLSDDELFKKRGECNKLIPQIDKLLKEDDASQGTNTILGKLYYSISMNSCLYSFSQFFHENGQTEETQMLKDGFTNEQLLFINGMRGTPDYEKSSHEFNKSLIQYQ